ncbi:hypothetical protein UPYG_G00156280 [Umbra pygmaea]|uniref:Uncharacterized protein n=1 Tax=Umbra pygmaea TaxID=75934 RepID=A0ABD0WY92_UMBPY
MQLLSGPMHTEENGPLDIETEGTQNRRPIQKKREERDEAEWEFHAKGELCKAGMMTSRMMMMRMKLLGLAFILSVITPCLSVYKSGECYFNTKGSCEYRGQVYGIGDSWMTKECSQCVCMEPFGVGCCDHGPQPLDYPDWCDVVRKPDSCTNLAVMKANHNLPCLWGRGRLRPGVRRPWKSDNHPVFGSVPNSATDEGEMSKVNKALTGLI